MRNVVVGPLAWLAVLVCTPAAQGPLPSQTPVFRTGIDAVQLDVSVLDQQRRPVRGLTAADFTVLEDGQARPIVGFSAVELPVGADDSAMRPIDGVTPDVVTNALPDGRLVVIMIDPILERASVGGRVTISDTPGIAAARATAGRILEALGPGDLAAVVHTTGGVPQNFTADKRRLRRAVERSSLGTIKRPEGEDSGECDCGVCRVDAIAHVATALRAEPQRRKTIFFIGEGIQLAPAPGRCRTYLRDATRRMVVATGLANVTVHAIDPNGLETTNVHAADDFRSTSGSSAAAAGQERANRANLMQRHESLRTLADWTGGRAILNTNAPDASVRTLLEESAAYYLLAFQSPGTRRDGGFRSLAVRVNRPGVQVHTRRGYYAEAPAAAGAGATGTALEESAGELLPRRGLPISVTAAPFRSADGSAAVVVTTRVSAKATVPPAPAAGSAPPLEAVEILTSAARAGSADVEWQRQRLSIGLGADMQYEVASLLRLAPGEYELRVAIRHQSSGLTGTARTYVDVPAAPGAALQLSGAVLIDPRSPTATPLEALQGVLPALPTARRSFTAADEVFLLMQASRESRDVRPEALHIRILDANLQEVAGEAVTVAGREFADDGSATVRHRLPLAGLAAGAYVLRVETVSTRDRVQREIPFSVQ